MEVWCLGAGWLTTVDGGVDVLLGILAVITAGGVSCELELVDVTVGLVATAVDDVDTDQVVAERLGSSLSTTKFGLLTPKTSSPNESMHVCGSGQLFSPRSANFNGQVPFAETLVFHARDPTCQHGYRFRERVWV